MFNEDLHSVVEQKETGIIFFFDTKDAYIFFKKENKITKIKEVNIVSI
jgi:hypothetical protein